MRKTIALAVLLSALGTFAFSPPARADDDGWHGRHGWQGDEWREHQWREHERAEREWREQRRHAYAEPYYGYYAPPPPNAYYPPVVVGYQPQPVPPPYVSPGLSFFWESR